MPGSRTAGARGKSSHCSPFWCVLAPGAFWLIDPYPSLCQALPSSYGQAAKGWLSSPERVMEGFSAIPCSLLSWRGDFLPSHQHSLWHFPGEDLSWHFQPQQRSVFPINPNFLSDQSKAEQGAPIEAFIKAPGTKFIFPAKIWSVLSNIPAAMTLTSWAQPEQPPPAPAGGCPGCWLILTAELPLPPWGTQGMPSPQLAPEMLQTLAGPAGFLLVHRAEAFGRAAGVLAAGREAGVGQCRCWWALRALAQLSGSMAGGGDWRRWHGGGSERAEMGTAGGGRQTLLCCYTEQKCWH